ncbi:MAG: nucleotide exchange factor GrpE [Lachnospiraceae bacterium]|uniref:nucleotide exchange factor GrpE n=1 Tax=Roseburia hominis TaxID=301301 RepID=UPI001F1A3EE7|nr:nucleotide exchange factor GrpE [Roseburia hominis]MCI5712424.1 nucleotide exchange factor GrpE [Lachnospiraceae bacterium]MDD6170130.1 nucleotide exchange factor GrpE [Lachnospiraceae bacterium]MDY4838573.1 nucleotide exchange factor GrpE [Lachnospiraceae bacterium]
MADQKEKEEVLEEVLEDLENESEKEEDTKKADEEVEENTESAEDKEADAKEKDAEASEDTEQKDAGKKKKESQKGVFKKKEKKDKKDEKIEELTDQVKRQMAEFDNFRKRTEKEKTQMFETGAKSVIEKILPVIDNFERGLSAVPEDAKEDAFVQGMDMVYKQLLNELDAIGVKAIEAVGNEFDPEYHNAVMQVESEEYESGVVAQELQKGYMYRDTVVRHSMVAVVQ